MILDYSERFKNFIVDEGKDFCESGVARGAGFKYNGCWLGYTKNLRKLFINCKRKGLG